MFENLAQYKILGRIGAGGMGEVYRARDSRLGRTVAVKVLPADVADDPERRDRFLREARASAAISHPNIAALYEIGEDQGRLFLAFEFVPGETLHAAIGGHPMNPRRALDLGVQMADALADAHAAGIVHRDIKPANVIVTPKGNAKILDFGLATWTAGGAEREHAADAATMMATSTGTALGTVAYMSPEQALGEPLDHRTDIFSLGIVLFEMLTGTLPFTGKTPTALALQIVQTPAPAPSSTAGSVPPELDAVVAKAVAKAPGDRYASAATFAADLRAAAAALDARVGMAKPALAASSGRPAGSRRSIVASIVAAAAVAALGAAGWIERDAVGHAWRRVAGTTFAPVIAVMPFELVSADQSRLYFADGLTDDIITRLGQVPGIRVIGRSSTRESRGKDPRAVARDLQAAVVLTGTVQPQANSVHMTVALIDPSDGTQIWSAQYTREAKDILAVQSEVAASVAARLRGTLVSNPALARAASRVVDQRAYDLYLQGRDRIARRRSEEAIPLLEQAIALDSGLAEAHAGLAEAIFRQWTFSGGTAGSDRVDARVRAEVDKAFAVDPDLPQAHYAASLVASNLADALQHLRAAIAADPSYAPAYHVVGDTIIGYDPRRAIDFYRASLKFDPHYDPNYGDIARAYLLLGQRDDAEREAAAVPLDPVNGRLMLAEYDIMEGRVKVPGDRLPTSGEYMSPWVRYARALVHVGRRDLAGLVLDSMLRLAPASCEAQALAAGALKQPGSRRARDRASSVLSQLAQGDQVGALNACGAVFGAVIGDPAKAAAYIDRVASHVNLTGLDDAQISGDLAVFDRRRRWYPWNQVSDDPRVVVAVGRLNAALAKVRSELPSMLPDLPAR